MLSGWCVLSGASIAPENENAGAALMGRIALRMPRGWWADQWTRDLRRRAVIQVADASRQRLLAWAQDIDDALTKLREYLRAW